MEWDGQERRKNNNDLIIEIHTDLRHMVKNFDNHVKEDSEKFNNINGKIDFQQKIIYGMMGALVIVEFILKVMK